MGGRGQYSIRKAASSAGLKKSTPFFQKKAETLPKSVERGTFGGGSDSGRQTDESMLAEFSDWRNNLTSNQVDAIAAYTNGSYDSINNYLRGKDYHYGGDHPEYTKEYGKQLKSAFNHALTKDITVYRGTGTKDTALAAQMKTVGAVFKDDGAISTSISRTFAKIWASGKSNPVVYTIKLPKGFKGAGYVQSISPHKHEKEALLKPGTNFKVLKELKPLSGIPHYLITPV